jgi:hypothetical protein
VNHMVSPKEGSLKCNDCHTRKDGRLAGLNDFYLPGRDNSKAADFGGFALIIITLIGVMSHMTLRIIKSRNVKTKEI